VSGKTMDIVWVVLPLLLAAFSFGLVLRFRRLGQAEWLLALAMAIFALLLGVGRLVPIDSEYFYQFLVLEALGLGVVVYLVWRYNRSTR
jgi:hypothetical protein